VVFLRLIYLPLSLGGSVVENDFQEALYKTCSNALLVG
jgi:hypothetical protein